MDRTFTYHISPEESGRTITQFLRPLGYSRHILTQLKQTEGGILLNGKPAFTNVSLKAGDVLTIFLKEQAPSENIPPAPVPFSLVYEDQDLLVVNKPADTPIHPSINNHLNTLANGMAFRCAAAGEPFVYRCINRLDRDTTGLLILARHALSGAILSGQMRRRQIHRTYLAIVKGNPGSGTVTAPIGRVPGSLVERRIDFAEGEPATTHFQTLCSGGGHALVSLQLETGRTHQIRVHMGYLGCPLIGDYLYFPDRSLMGRQALHSWKLEFSHPITGEPLSFAAPLPEDMRRALASLSLDWPMAEKKTALVISLLALKK